MIFFVLYLQISHASFLLRQFLKLVRLSYLAMMARLTGWRKTVAALILASILIYALSSVFSGKAR